MAWVCGCPLFYRDTFGQVARLVDIAAERDREVIGEQLQRDHGQDRHHDLIGPRHDNSVVRNPLQLAGAALGRNRDDRPFARPDLLDVV